MRPIIAILTFLTVSLAGCSPRMNKNDNVTLLTLKGPSAMGMIHLIDKPDQIIPESLTIEILDDPMLIRARIMKDSPELAVLPLNMASILYNKEIPYQVIAIPVWGTLYLFGSDSTIAGWPALRNKRVYLMGNGTTPDILFRYLLTFHGLIPDQDVILDYSFPTHIDLANAVGAGQAALAVISEPLVSLVKAGNPSILQIMDLNTEWTGALPGHPAMPQTALIGRKDFLHDHPDWVMKICEAWKRSTGEVNLHPEAAAARIVFYKILPEPAIAISSIPRCNLNFRYADEIRNEIGQYLQVFFTFNPDAVGSKLPDEKFIFQRPDH
ncbi:MAG: hypothetical protein WC699_14290 [Bacteroidales bacterium]